MKGKSIEKHMPPANDVQSNESSTLSYRITISRTHSNHFHLMHILAYDMCGGLQCILIEPNPCEGGYSIVFPNVLQAKGQMWRNIPHPMHNVMDFYS